EGEVILATFTETKHRVTLRGTDREFAVLRSVRCVKHRLKVDLLAFLFVRNGLAEDRVHVIEQAFDDFVISEDSLGEDVTQIEQLLVSRGIGLDDYYVKLIFTLERLESTEAFDNGPDVIGAINSEEKYEIRSWIE